MVRIDFYQYNGKNNVVSKVLDNNTLHSEYGLFFDAFDIINPSLKIRTNTDFQNLQTFNYAYVNGKYYFIENVTILSNTTYKIDLRLDVLTTYQTEIKAATATVINKENANNYISNREIIYNVIPTIQKLTFSENTPFDANGKIIMVALKGKI